MRFFKRAIATGAVLWTAIFCCSCAVDHHFIRSDSVVYREIPEFAQEHTFDSDGLELHGWYIPATSPVKGTIIHFHGNDKNLTHHYLYSKWFRDVGYNVFIFDYRGYGKSQGLATIDGMIRDGRSAMEYIRKMKGIGTEPLFIFAQSMGTVPAVQALATTPGLPVRGLILDSAIASMKRLGYEHLKRTDYIWPLYYLPWLIVPSRYTSLSAVKRLPPLPVLIIHGKGDTFINPDHSLDLAQATPGKSELHIMEGVGHVDAFSFHLSRSKPLVLRFLEACSAPKH